MAVCMMSPLTTAAPSGRSLSDAALCGVIRSLAPLQALSGGLRALPCDPDRVQSSPTADSGAPSDASDRGVLARARVLSARLARVDVADRVTLEWLVTYAHADAGVDTLADLIARTLAFGLRDVADRTTEEHARAGRARRVIEQEAAMARTRLRHGAVLSTDATIAERLRAAEAHEADADRRRKTAADLLRRWGRERIERAAMAWEAARNT